MCGKDRTGCWCPGCYAFGTLLGPGTTTGPDPLAGVGFVVVPGFPRTTELTDMNTLVLLVGMCVVGLLFENYIVNASIFIRSNFFEIFEPGSDTFGCWFSWFSR